ncbi:hypothetical protein T484DRAFT_1895038 [Baffinella frigidus]|nr:hypothetical protein T484DRAFT_1895038 [Cryptophyta sp. CCMP2293]
MMHGRANFPGVYRVLPFHDDVEAIRYTLGLHYAGVMLGGIAGAALLRAIVEALHRFSAHPFYRMSVFFSVLFVTLVFAGQAVDRQVQSMPYSKAKSFDIHHHDYADVAKHLRESVLPNEAAGRFMVLKKGSSHYTLNLLSRVAARPGAISYSRGYHDTLSFWFMEHFYWSESMFRLYNIQQVVVATKNVTQTPAYFRTSYPACAESPFHKKCMEEAAYSVHSVRKRFGYFEFVSSPIVVCSEAGTKAAALRHLLNNITRPLFEQNILPILQAPSSSLWRGASCAGALASLHSLTGAPEEEELAAVTLHRDNLAHVSSEALKGPETLLAAVNAFATFTLEVEGAFKLRGGMRHVGGKIAGLFQTDLARHTSPAARAFCSVDDISLEGGSAGSNGRFRARVKCPPGFEATTADLLLFKTSFHPLWTAHASRRKGGARTQLQLVHVATNLMGVYVRPLLLAHEATTTKDGATTEGGGGLEVEIDFEYRQPREQYVLLLLSMALLAHLAASLPRSNFSLRSALWLWPFSAEVSGASLGEARKLD